MNLLSVPAKLKSLVNQLDSRTRYLPPESMFADPDRVDGSRSTSEFVAVGKATVGWLIEYEGLQPSHRFLDIGCGIGRMARPLMSHLDKGKYHGFDISAAKVAYCKRTILPSRSDFVFHHADVFNTYYNPTGRLKGAEYRFPFDDGSFDFILLVSVFTHMLPVDLEHYLSEIARVLSPGGKCVSSYWLTDTPKGAPFHRYSEVSEIYNPEEPEHGVYYLESYIRDLHDHRGLRIQTLMPGSDRKKPHSNPNSRQDIIIAIKP